MDINIDIDMDMDIAFPRILMRLLPCHSQWRRGKALQHMLEWISFCLLLHLASHYFLLILVVSYAALFLCKRICSVPGLQANWRIFCKRKLWAVSELSPMQLPSPFHSLALILKTHLLALPLPLEFDSPNALIMLFGSLGNIRERKKRVL